MNIVRLALLTVFIVPFPVIAANAGSTAGAPVVDLPPGSALAALRSKAEQGDGKSQYDLGLAYFQGTQTERNFVEAFVWLTLASEHGVTGEAMTPVIHGLQLSQLAETRQRLESLRAAYPSLRAGASPWNPKAPAGDRGAGATVAAPPSQPAAAPAPMVGVSSPAPSAAVDANRLREQLGAAEFQLREIQKNLDRKSTELGQAQTDVESARQALATADKKAASDTALQNSRIAALEEKLTDTTRELSQAKEGLVAAAATAKFAGAQTDAATESESKLSALRSEINTLERELNTAKAAAAVSAATQTALAAANQKLAESNRELATLRQRTDDNQRALSTGPDQQLAALQAELNEARAKLSVAEKTAADRRYEVTGLRVALDAVASHPKISPADLETARRDAAQARQELAKATEELTTLRSQAAAARDLEARVRQLEAEKSPLSTTTMPTSARPVRLHTISAGETLTGLALTYYGNASRWREILAANRDVVPDERTLVVGKTLRIP